MAIRRPPRPPRRPRPLRVALAAALWAAAAAPEPRARPGELPPSEPQTSQQDPLRHPLERHLRNIRQLTFGGENAEGYFSADDRRIIFQSTRPPFQCDQIFILSLETPQAPPRIVSTGRGPTTCAYFFPGGDRILYSSAHAAQRECPPRPDDSRGYVWPVDPAYEIYTANPDGSDLRRLTHSPGYDAEATISRDGRKIVFTSVRDGDLDLYVMNADGSNVTRVTHELGYDGGAFFSYDGSKIVYRAHHPTTPAEVADHRALLEQNLIRPATLEIFVMNADGTGKRQVTRNGAANFAPYFFPDGERIIFASNLHDPKGRNFDLYMIRVDGTGLERLTYDQAFDSFPMFNSDGTKLVWASNRNASRPGETNLFIADWVP